MEGWREWAATGTAALGLGCLLAGWGAGLTALRALGVLGVGAGLVALYRQTDAPSSPEGAEAQDAPGLLWRRWRKQLRSLYSALLFALGVSLLFQSWEIGWVVTLGLGVHELGHVLAAWQWGIESEVGFGPLGAWTRTSAPKRRALGHYANSLIHLAGPLASLTFALLALGIQALFYRGAPPGFWQSQANFSALVAVLNLLPMGELSDGGKFVKRLFASAGERLEQRLLALVGVLPVVFVAVALIAHLDWARLLALLIIVLWFAISMLLESRRDDPTAAGSPRAMTARQARELLSATLLMLLVGMGTILRTPFWLTREHVAQMVAGLSGLAVYVVWESPTTLRVGLGLALLLILLLALSLSLRRRREAGERPSGGQDEQS